jgi:hypothetical protein
MGAKSAFLGFPLSCLAFFDGEPVQRRAASEAPFQDRWERQSSADIRLSICVDLVSIETHS